MVNLTRIYTRTGDAGRTQLGDMSDDLEDRPAAARRTPTSTRPTPTSAWRWPSAGSTTTSSRCSPTCRTTSSTSAPTSARPSWPTRSIPPLRIEQDYVDRLEGWCDHYNEELPTLRSFILNGGTVGAAHLHVARTVVRRAERAAWAAWAEHEDTMNLLAITYLNRLSDLLFILARHANREHGDVLWVPGGDRSAD